MKSSKNKYKKNKTGILNNIYKLMHQHFSELIHILYKTKNFDDIASTKIKLAFSKKYNL